MVLVMRTLVVAVALEPGIDPAIVAFGYPVAALITAVPITPAGLGVAEWTWSGFLIAGGAAPAVAAIIAVSFRVVGICSLIVLVLILHLVMMWKSDA